MKKGSKEKHFIQSPTFEGGQKGIKAHIKSNLRYPEEAKKEKIEGTVMVKYSINYKGEVVKTKILKSLGYGCDEEAKRIIKRLKFKVSKVRSIKVLFHMQIQIHFRLPPVSKTGNVKYNYYSTTTEKGNSYNYIINL